MNLQQGIKHIFLLGIIYLILSASILETIPTIYAQVTEIPQEEYNALVALYNSTNGANWPNKSGWLTTNPPSSWYGVTVNEGHVIGLVLDYNNLNGSIPPELGNLDNLQRLGLDGNKLSGSIPPELENLSNLQELGLSGNKLSGSIPPELGNLSNLQKLYLERNQLSGSIPPELGNLNNLQTLELNSNYQLSGSIPPELGNLSNLQKLYLGFNQLSGSIPPELGNLSNLIDLKLGSNQLSGSIPPELGNLSNLLILILYYNQFSGSIPLNFTNLVNLYMFYFDNTNLCEPEDPAFQAWLDGISYLSSTGIICGNEFGFLPNPNGWRFGNTETNMWPEEWWSQFDYSSNVYLDPDDAFNINSSRRFPDWFLFVDAFGEEQCYFQNGVIPIPSAYLMWWVLSYPTPQKEFPIPHDFVYWKGSCFGFAISSFMAYDFKTLFSYKFSNIGNFNNLFELTINNERRKCINQLWIYQFGLDQLSHILKHQTKKPFQTLNECKQMFSNEIRNDKILVFFNQNGSGGHAVNPYKIERSSSNNEIENIYVYDNNYPGETKAVEINTVNNTWNYIRSDGNWGGSEGLFLMDPVGNYFDNPNLSYNTQDVSNKDNYINIFNNPGTSIEIENGNGEFIGYGDSLAFNNFNDGASIIPITGGFHPPVGYFLPKENYTIKMRDFLDSLVYLSVFTDSIVFSYKRKDALQKQTDEFEYGNSITLKNHDNQIKIIDLETILIENDNEKVFLLENIDLVQSDSLSINILKQKDCQVVNHGFPKKYDLKINLIADDKKQYFEFKDISITSNSAQLISPYWDNLAEEPVQIFIDNGIDGTFDDTLNIVNQISSVQPKNNSNQIPTNYKLYQNYPNPFNSETSLSFYLYKEENVEIYIYNQNGQIVHKIIDDYLKAGNYQVSWNAINNVGAPISNGIYFCKMTAGNYRHTIKMLFLK